MHIIRHYHNIPEFAKNSVIALGNFDGVHLGHQKLLSETVRIAKEKGQKTAVMSFEPHPLTILRNKKNIRIFGLAEKIAFLKEQNIDFLFLLKFDHDFAKVSAQDFLQDILLDKLAISHIVTGYDFIFGHNRGGNADFLEQQAKNSSYGFTRIDLQKSDDDVENYSSSAIRRYLVEGNLAQVKKYLGKNYFVSARVENGDKRGREIGFPTANLSLNDLFKIKFGVYAVRVKYAGKTYDAVANLGIRPSFTSNKELLEVHIFNFKQDIYGKKIIVEFIEFIREEKKFANLDELKAQISKDLNDSKRILENVENI